MLELKNNLYNWIWLIGILTIFYLALFQNSVGLAIVFVLIYAEIRAGNIFQWEEQDGRKTNTRSKRRN